MKKSKQIEKEIIKLAQERDYCDAHDFDKRSYLNARIEILLHEYEIQLNTEAGLK